MVICYRARTSEQVETKMAAIFEAIAAIAACLGAPLTD